MVIASLIKEQAGNPTTPQTSQDPRISECRLKGGTWDANLQKCIMPKDPITEAVGKQTSTANVPAAKDIDQKLTPQEKTGEPVVTDTLGNERLAPQGQEANEARQNEVDLLNAIDPNAPSAKEAVIANQQQAELRQLLLKVGQPGQLTAAQEADINFSQAATAGAAAAVPGILGGAIGGATIGALGGPIGIAGGAVIGGAGTFVSGILRNIKDQQRGEIQAATIELTNGRTAMRQYAMAASRDPANADVYIGLYNQAVTRMHQARRQVKAETSGDLNAWMDDGRADLANFDSYLGEGGLAETYGIKLQTSLLTGVPLSINGEELFFDDS